MDRHAGQRRILGMLHAVAERVELYIAANAYRQHFAEIVLHGVDRGSESDLRDLVVVDNNAARRAGMSVVLEVSDNGPGIAADHIEKIFEPLFTTRVNGIGLGLAVSRSFAEANNGSLTVSSPPGRGATFELAFPVAPVVA